MQVVKIENDVFLADGIDGDTLENAMMVGSSLTTEISKRAFGDFLCAEHLGRLVTMSVGTQSAVATRELSEIELIRYQTAVSEFDVATDLATKKLVVHYFQANF